jgi:hypothetical protein
MIIDGKCRHSSGGAGRARSCGAWMAVMLLNAAAVTVGLILPKAVRAKEPDPSHTIVLRVTNYSQVSDAVLVQGQRQAEQILEEAGITAIWLDCPLPKIEGLSEGLCQQALKSNEIVLRVLTEPRHHEYQDDVFGFSVLPVLASIYVEPARRRAVTDGANFELPAILGAAIAHEVGHLLLGEHSHSSSGIMQAKWGRNQVRAVNMGSLLFTSKESKLMRADLERRTTPNPGTTTLAQERQILRKNVERNSNDSKENNFVAKAAGS